MTETSAKSIEDIYSGWGRERSMPPSIIGGKFPIEYFNEFRKGIWKHFGILPQVLEVPLTETAYLHFLSGMAGNELEDPHGASGTKLLNVVQSHTLGVKLLLIHLGYLPNEVAELAQEAKDDPREMSYYREMLQELIESDPNYHMELKLAQLNGIIPHHKQKKN